MEPLHRISLIPKAPASKISWHKKIIRIIHIVGFVFTAVFFGVGFVEGMFSFASKSVAFARNTFLGEAKIGNIYTIEKIIEKKGSDDKSKVFPISLYNVNGRPTSINADAYIVGDLETGEVIISREPERVFPIASVSKLTTALVALDHFTSKQDAIVSKSALATYGPSGGLRSGEKVKALDLLYPLLLESSNDVAELISEQFEKGQFPKLMNEKVASLGMSKTSYEEASGLSPKNVSTANDLFVLAQYIYNEVPKILDITRIREFSLMNHTWNNYNYFLKNKTFIGGKNGYTDEALRTAVEFFDLPIKNGTTTENHIVSIIVLHTETREQDIIKLLDFLKKTVSLGQ